MSGKQRILRSIAAVAMRLGRSPSVSEFVVLAGISRYAVSKFFPRWNDAVRAAGLHPLRLRVRPEDSELLRDWGETVRRKRTCFRRTPICSRENMTLGHWKNDSAAGRHFQRLFANLLRASGSGRTSWRSCLFPNQRRSPRRTKTRLQRLRCTTEKREDRPTYGNPIDFRGQRHEPVNEQGVVLLFGMVAKELGYMVEAVQTGFPDCEAKRQTGPDRWQRVHIEFEF